MRGWFFGGAFEGIGYFFFVLASIFIDHVELFYDLGTHFLLKIEALIFYFVARLFNLF